MEYNVPRTLSHGDNARVITCSLLGDGMVGKTCLVHSYISGYFKSRYVATVSDQYTAPLLKQEEEEEIFLNIHDTAGQSDFDKFRTSTYMDSEVLILCFSVCDIESFSSISSFWLPEIKHNSERKQPIILVGTQTDMRSGDTTKEVTRAEGQRMAKLIGAETYVECSARRRAGLDHVFESVIEAAFRRRKRKESILRRIFLFQR